MPSTSQTGPKLALLTPKEAASFLNIATGSMANMRVQQTGPAFIKIGKAVRYSQEALMEYLLRNTHCSTATSQGRS